MDAVPPVTAHAVLRYLKRIEGYDLRPLVTRLGRDCGNWRLARAAAEDLGVPLIAIMRRILPEKLEQAVRAGAARIRRPGFFLICENGMVITVAGDVRNHAARILSRREIRRGSQAAHRRGRL